MYHLLPLRPRDPGRAVYPEMMTADCHIHMVLDGVDFRAAIAAHRLRPREEIIRRRLARYQALGFTYLRDGGDRWGVGLLAKALAGEYGITYRSPAFPIHRVGHYGSFIGLGYESLAQYRQRLAQAKAQGADFIKLMISGLMDFHQAGRLTEPGLPPEEIRTLIHIAQDAGFAVMAHANGAGTVVAAAEAGVDSIEHGAYLNPEALAAMAGRRVIWVPTLATIGNLRGTGRFPQREVEAILASAQENLRRFAAMGGLIAPGSDAGAFAVPHGQGSVDEYRLLEEALGPGAQDVLARGIAALQARF